MALLTKCILAPKSKEDGIRISVMSRHTLNDGVTPHPEINKNTYDVWQKEVAPSDKLIGDYYKRGLSWEKSEEAYLVYLRSEDKKEEVIALAQIALTKDITILCIEKTPEKCHRRLLAEECKRLEPRLIIKVR